MYVDVISFEFNLVNIIMEILYGGLLLKIHVVKICKVYACVEPITHTRDSTFFSRYLFK